MHSIKSKPTLLFDIKSIHINYTIEYT